nr:hypothetical protein CWKEJDCK_CWKEJDCK_CDS_0002 [Microvirus sp.]
MLIINTVDKVLVIFRRAGHRLRCFCNWLALFPRCVLDWSTDNPDHGESSVGGDKE